MMTGLALFAVSEDSSGVGAVLALLLSADSAL